MQRLDGQLILSPSDLTGHLACEHLTTLDALLARGAVALATLDDPASDAVRARGFDHERKKLDGMEARGLTVAKFGAPAHTRAGLEAAASATLDAMRAGADVIYQGTFFDGRWRGHPDFLLRVDGPGALRYEVADAKLARHAKPSALIQMCGYSEHLARIQGVAPEHMTVMLGDGSDRVFRVEPFMPYYRNARRRLELALDAPHAPTYPHPVEHCAICRWAPRCDAQRLADDHLSLVASMRRDQTRKLEAASITTLARLAKAPERPDGTAIAVTTYDRLHHQARLQLAQRADGVVRFETLPLEPERGLALLPAPSPGDLFFDMEGDPLVEGGGLEYLFGVVEIVRDQPAFRAFWAHDRAAEKLAFEGCVDMLCARLATYPTLHVYHYAAYERSALARLAAHHGTREAEVDRLLRGGVLVDLYAVVQQAIRVSQDSYSIKKLEPLYMDKREGAVLDAASSIAEYERWLHTREPKILESIEQYNRVDCESTWRLREWLEERRASLGGDATIARPLPVNAEVSEQRAEIDAATEKRVAKLTDGVPEDPSARSDDEQGRWLLAQMLEWHKREDRSEWAAFFRRCAMTDEQLADEDTESIGKMTYVGVVGEVRKSLVHRHRFDTEQDYKLGVGDKPVDPATGKSCGQIVALDAEQGYVDLLRGAKSTAPNPSSLIPGRPLETTAQRDSIAAIADWVIAHGIDGSGAYRATRDLLLRHGPRVLGGWSKIMAEPECVATAQRAALELDAGCLPVQGPPGSGKTHAGAHMIVALLAAGKSVGITANSHSVIGNLLAKVCSVARDEGVRVRAVQKSREGQECNEPEVTQAEESVDVLAALVTGSANVAAGTAWLFARDDMDTKIDTLFVDEAGQLSLANVVAVSRCARNVVLLGDPRQLAQPSRGAHPPGAERSALEHAIGSAATLAAERGLFLSETWRMHPALCEVVSRIAYDAKLHARPECARQRIDGAGPWSRAGVHFVPVEHRGNRAESREEAVRVGEIAREIIGRRWIDRDGNARMLSATDVLVVAPYNAHVKALLREVPHGVRVGTVDKFQGREAPVAIYSMATSSVEDLPRDVGFLYSVNRLNVALSRAQVLAIVVCSPLLLAARASTPENLERISALCAVAEAAGV